MPWMGFHCTLVSSDVLQEAEKWGRGLERVLDSGFSILLLTILSEEAIYIFFFQ